LESLDSQLFYFNFFNNKNKPFLKDNKASRCNISQRTF